MRWASEEGALDTDLSDRDWSTWLTDVGEKTLSVADANRSLGQLLAFLATKTKAEIQTRAVAHKLLIAPTYWGLISLRRFLKACCAEDYLGTQNSRLLKRFALGLMGSALLSPICGAALSVVLTMHNPPGQKMLAISIGSNQFILAGVGALIFLLANLLKRASLIAEEHAQII